MAHIQGYRLLRNDRRDRRCGGVALYVHNTLNYRLLSISNNEAENKVAKYLTC